MIGVLDKEEELTAGFSLTVLLWNLYQLLYMLNNSIKDQV